MVRRNTPDNLKIRSNALARTLQDIALSLNSPAFYVANKVYTSLRKRKVQRNRLNNNLNANASAIYVSYPSYQGYAERGYAGADIVKKVVGGDSKLPVGHNAFILVNPDGHTEFYEYGRYNKGDGQIVGTYIKDKGNWVRRPIPDKLSNETNEQYLQRLKRTGKLPHANQGNVYGTSIDNTDNEKIRSYIKDQARDSLRADYSLFNTCGNQARNAVTQGLSTLQMFENMANPLTYFKALPIGVKSVVDSKGWGLLPNSSQSIGNSMNLYGEPIDANMK